MSPVNFAREKTVGIRNSLSSQHCTLACVISWHVAFDIIIHLNLAAVPFTNPNGVNTIESFIGTRPVSDGETTPILLVRKGLAMIVLAMNIWSK